MNERTKKVIEQVDADLEQICHLWDAALGFFDFIRPAQAERVLEGIILGHHTGMGLEHTPWTEALMMRTVLMVLDKIAGSPQDFPHAGKCFPRPEAFMDLITGNAEQTPDVVKAKKILEPLTQKQQYETSKHGLGLVIAYGEAEFRKEGGNVTGAV